MNANEVTTPARPMIPERTARKPRSDKGVRRGPYKPRKEKPTLNEVFLGNLAGGPQ